MSPNDYRELVDLVETWEIRKRTIFSDNPYKDGSNAVSLRQFVELQNMLSRKLISEFGRQDAGFYESIVELALNAQRIVEKGRIFVNGSDVTKEGM